mgnify:CR=1 FL=1|jgi:hypothetical protein
MIKKVTEKHFRKYYSPDFISSVARKNNLRCIYGVEDRVFPNGRKMILLFLSKFILKINLFKISFFFK